MEKDLSYNQKYLLAKEYPRLFYLKFFKSVDVHFDHNPILIKVKKAMVLGNN